MRAEHSGMKQQRPLLTISEARKRRPGFAWDAGLIAVPSFTGIRTLDPFPLERLIPFIDWTPFFHAWKLRGRYPDILADAEVGARATELWQDAQALLELILTRRLISARAVYGFFPACSAGDDIEVCADDTGLQLQAKFHTLRQQSEKPGGQANFALADFIAPKGLGIRDYIGAFAVTAGFGVDELCRRFEGEHDDYRSILTKALADRLAEAFAECLHKTVRDEWGYGLRENLAAEDLIRERYRGIRPAPGYPACPDHTEKRTLFDLLAVERQTGIVLTESYAMMPASSVCGLYFAHPEAKYFAVGKIGRDQAIDYAARKGMDLAAIERWLAPNLAYEPWLEARSQKPEAERA